MPGMLDFLDSAQAQIEQSDEAASAQRTDYARVLVGRAVEDLIGAVWALAPARDAMEKCACAHSHHRHRVGGPCRDCGRCTGFTRREVPGA